MIKNYFLTAIRTIRAARVFAAINILGLAIGISAALVIYLIVRFDLSFEDFQTNGHRLYRVVTDAHLDGEEFYLAGVPYPLRAAAGKELTGLTRTIPIWPAGMRVTILRKNDPAVFRLPKQVFTDAAYFQSFHFYKWLAGSAKDLDAPSYTVLTVSRAAAYFPGLAPAQVIGKNILYDDSLNATVAGVVSDPPLNTDFDWQEFISDAGLPHTPLRQYANPDDWVGFIGSCQLMVELAPGTDTAAINHQLAALREKYLGKQAAALYVHRLQPLYDIHFNARYDAFFHRFAHKPTLYGLMLVAAFLLLLGCINFINLSTAQAARRAKEIGIRKTLGSTQRHILFQFLGEAFLLTLLSLALSLVLTPWLLHAFSDFIPPELHFNFLHQPHIWSFAFVLLGTVTLLAGFYPSLILSRFKPVKVLNNQSWSGSASTRSGTLRKVLTVSQFVIAQAFVIATLLVGRQLHYTMNADLGFKKEAIVDFNLPFAFGQQDKRPGLLLDRIRPIPGVAIAASGGPTPSLEGNETNELRYSDGKKNVNMQVDIRYGDTNFIKVYALHLLAGRNVRPSDTLRELLINRTYCSILGFKTPAEAIGKTVTDGNQIVPIVGVIADFHQASLHTPIKPLALACSYDQQFYIHIGLQPQLPGSNSWQKTLARVKTAYESIYPGREFDFEFFDESIAKYYTAEQHLSRLLQWATGLTILISCLGLAGLVIFTTNTRTKEIGIRKVLGASVTAIVALLSKDFIKLLLIAFVIAAPIAWWTIHRWLEGFAYRTPISWWAFPLAGGGMIATALLTMSIRTIRTATANPVRTLRCD